MNGDAQRRAEEGGQSASFAGSELAGWSATTAPSDPDSRSATTTRSEPSSHPAATAGPARDPRSIAIVGLACRYPDADDPAALLDLVMTGRQAFRRIPPCRVDLADYYSAYRGTPDATYSTRAGLIEGWRFDRAAFGVPASTFSATDPAHWLALETAARALSSAGFAGGAGLPRDTTGVFIGNTLASDVSRASALRLRWPYSRRVMADAMHAAGVPADVARRVLRVAAARYLAPLPQVTAETLADSMPGTIATAICGQLGLRGGGRTVDASGAASLAAIASACLALASGELDAALAGGVDLSIDPLDLVGLAKSGMLATNEMLVYDEHPTGFLPGEGCGMVLLMRAADARAARLPIQAEILGWGIASAGSPATPGQEPSQHGEVAAEAASHLLAMHQAYRMARVDPADIQLVEGSGTGLAVSDEAELTALTALRDGSTHHVAALGSITANIGNTRAAAGAAGLIKTALAVSNGVLPPSSGIRTPHPMLVDGRAALRLPTAPESWPDGTRHAAVGALGSDGLTVHLVLRGGARPEPAARSSRLRPFLGAPRLPGPRLGSSRLGGSRIKGSRLGKSRLPVDNEPEFRQVAAWPRATYVTGASPAAFLLRAPDRPALIAVLTRLAEVAPWLSDGEMQDLAVKLANDVANPSDAAEAGQPRVAIVAARQEHLARLTRQALTMLPGLTARRLAAKPGVFAAYGPPGNITLLLSGRSAGATAAPEHELSRILAALRWLDDIGISAAAAVGHGVGELAGLAWAGCTTPSDARKLLAVRAAALTAPAESAPGQLCSAIDAFSAFEFNPPQRRLISGCLGAEITGPDAIAELLSTELFEARLAVDRRLLVPAGLSTGTAAHVDDGGWPGADPRVGTGDARTPAWRQDRGEQLKAAVIAGAADTALMVLTSEDRDLSAAAGEIAAAPVVTIEGDLADGRNAGDVASATAALFAAGALTSPEQMYAGRPSRPIDIWREQIFITNPCESQPRLADSGTADASRAIDTSKAIDTKDAEGAIATDADDAADTNADDESSALVAVGSAAERAVGTDPGLTGVAPWSRCYAEEERTPGDSIPLADDRPWRLYSSGCEPLRPKVDELFRHDPDAERTLAVLGDRLDEATIAAAVRAAKDAIGTQQLVVISSGMALTGLWASLRAEHPSIGITVIRSPMTREGIEHAREIAAVTPGEYRELIIADDGTVREPAMVPVATHGGADFPLGHNDVVLISRGAGAAGLVLAQVLACSGAGLAIIGRDHAEPDQEFIAALERLRCGGAKLGYEVVDTANQAGMTDAVRRIEQRLGPITAIAHATMPTPPVPVAELTPAAVNQPLRDQTGVLEQMVAATRSAATSNAPGTGQLRLIATFGSVVGRYGLTNEGILALVTGALADLGEQLAAASPGCLALHIDWPGWAAAGLGERGDLAGSMERAGFTPMPLEAASRLLLKLLSTPGLPRRLAVHGRVGVPAPWAITVGGARGDERPPGRFAERVLAHYPGTELVLAANLSLRTDPYLAEYRIDGLPVLPPTMAIEAMAQAASVLAGAPVRTATQVTMAAPIVLPDGSNSSTEIRICALRESDQVCVVVRCESSGFSVDHCKAVFSCPPGVGGSGGVAAGTVAAGTVAAGTVAAGTVAAGGVGEQTRAESAAKAVRIPAQLRIGNRRQRSDRSEPIAEAVDAGEIYDSICFQTGRFRRITTLWPAGSQSATALVKGPDEMPWFGAANVSGRRTRTRASEPKGGSANERMLLGSPGLNDATLQVVQACVPHRRLMLIGCESVSFSGAVAAEVAQIRVRQPAGSAANAESVWDVDVTDAAGEPLVHWKRLRMREAGALPHPDPWPAPLLANYLELAATELGLGPDMQVRINHREKAGDSPVAAVQKGGAATDGAGWAPAASEGVLADLVLRVRASAAAACGWARVKQSRTAIPADDREAGSGGDASPPVDQAEPGSAWLALIESLQRAQPNLIAPVVDQAADPASATAAAKAAAAARASAIAACLRSASVPADIAVSVRDVAGACWLLIRTGQASIASLLTEIAGIGEPIAIAVRTGTPSRRATTANAPAADGAGAKAPAAQASAAKAPVGEAAAAKAPATEAAAAEAAAARAPATEAAATDNAAGGPAAKSPATKRTAGKSTAAKGTAARGAPAKSTAADRTQASATRGAASARTTHRSTKTSATTSTTTSTPSSTARSTARSTTTERPARPAHRRPKQPATRKRS